MVGGSLAAALQARGWHVTGDDVDTARAEEARRRGVISAVGVDPSAEITFIATPVSAIPERAHVALAHGGIVSDVGSVKGVVAGAVQHERFVPGHPMAGSEVAGLDGVDAELFSGVTWVLTPSIATSPEAYLEVHNVVTSLGASVVTLDAAEHDDIVATVSHVPHFAAVALMNLACARSEKHEALMRLAATGFRDMTRIAAGHPKLWADIALQNASALVEGLGRLVDGIEEVRELIAAGSQERLEVLLSGASTARRDLPLRAGRPTALLLARIPVPDQPGALGEVLGIFGGLRVNVEDVEIVHDRSAERGTLHVTIDAGAGPAVRQAFVDRGMRITLEEM